MDWRCICRLPKTNSITGVIERTRDGPWKRVGREAVLALKGSETRNDLPRGIKFCRELETVSEARGYPRVSGEECSSMCLQSSLSSNCTPSLSRKLPPPADTDLIFIAISQAPNHCFTFEGPSEWSLHEHKWYVTGGNEWQQIPQRKVIENKAFIKSHRREGDTPKGHYWTITTWKSSYLLASGSFRQPLTHIHDPAADDEAALREETTTASAQILPATSISSAIKTQNAASNLNEIDINPEIVNGSNGTKSIEAAVPVGTSTTTIKMRSGPISHDSEVIATPSTGRPKRSRASTLAGQGDENLDTTGRASKRKCISSNTPQKRTTEKEILKQGSHDTPYLQSTTLTCPEQTEKVDGLNGAKSIGIEMTEALAIPINPLTESEPPRHHKDVFNTSKCSLDAEDENNETDLARNPEISRPLQRMNSHYADGNGVIRVEPHLTKTDDDRRSVQAAKLPSQTDHRGPRRSARVSQMNPVKECVYSENTVHRGKDRQPDSGHAKKTLFAASFRNPKKNAIIQSTGTGQKAEGFEGTLKFLSHKGDGRCTHEGACTGLGCDCAVNGKYCKQACGCPPECPRQFPPCGCIGGLCSSTCDCRVNQHECDPRRCSCGPNCSNYFEKESAKLYVQVSNIPRAGKGLFAGEDIEAGNFIGEYTGQIRSLSNGHAGSTVSLFDISADRAIDGHRNRSHVYYINHGAKNAVQNAIFQYCDAVDRRKVLVFARKKIKEGEEILCSYGGNRRRWVFHNKDTTKKASLLLAGIQLACGQYVYVRGENDEEQINTPWIGKIIDTRLKPEREVMVQWTYHPANIKLPRYHFGAKEILLSTGHTDWISTDCLDGFAKVGEECKGCEEHDWCFHRRYDVSNGKISTA